MFSPQAESSSRMAHNAVTTYTVKHLGPTPMLTLSLERGTQNLHLKPLSSNIRIYTLLSVK